MAKRPTGGIAEEETSLAPDRPSPPGMPRWVRLFAILVGGLVLLLLASMLLGIGGRHGPAMHGPGPEAPAGDHQGGALPIDGAAELAIAAEGLAFDPDRVELTAGEPVNVALTSGDTLHDLTVDEVDFHLAAEPGETVTGGLVIAEPGIYIGYCSVAGHREAGMELEFVVTPSAEGTPPGDHAPVEGGHG